MVVAYYIIIFILSSSGSSLHHVIQLYTNPHCEIKISNSHLENLTFCQKKKKNLFDLWPSLIGNYGRAVYSEYDLTCHWSSTLMRTEIEYKRNKFLTGCSRIAESWVFRQKNNVFKWLWTRLITYNLLWGNTCNFTTWYHEYNVNVHNNM